MKILHTEKHHTEGKPSEVVELYRTLDLICQNLAPEQVTRSYKSKHIAWSIDNKIFCSTHIQKSGLRVWLKLSPEILDASIPFARDVSNIRHYGHGDVEFALNGRERLRKTEPFIKESFLNMSQK